MRSFLQMNYFINSAGLIAAAIAFIAAWNVLRFADWCGLISTATEVLFDRF